MKRLITIILVLLALCSPRLWAAYFVNPDAANDTGAGTTGDPWKTLGAHIATIATSDDVYFLAGKTITENSVLWADSGVTGDWCIIGRYDSGGIGVNTADANPVWALPNDQNYAIGTFGRNYIRVENIKFTGGRENAAGRLLYFYGTGFHDILVNACTFDSYITDQAIQLAQTTSDIYNVDITNCTFSNATGATVNQEGIRVAQTGTNTVYNFNVTSCTFNAVRWGIRFYYAWTADAEPATQIYDIDINGCTFTSMNGNAVTFHGGTGTTATSYIRNCTLTTIGTAAIDYTNALQLSYCKNLIVEYNTIDGVDADPAHGDGDGIIIDYGHSLNTFISDGVIVRNNRITNCDKTGAAGVSIYKGMNCQIYNNYLYGNTNGINHSSSESTGNVFYNNTVINNSARGASIAASAPAGTWRNNIFAGNGTYGMYESATNPVESYNLFYNNTTAAVSGFSADATDLTSNPLLTGLEIGYSSPCKNAGATLVSVTSDIRGMFRPRGSAYDIGAYELSGKKSTVGGMGSRNKIIGGKTPN